MAKVGKTVSLVMVATEDFAITSISSNRNSKQSLFATFALNDKNLWLWPYYYFLLDFAFNFFSARFLPRLTKLRRN